MRNFTSFVVVTICLLINSSVFAQMAASSCTPMFLDSNLSCSDGMYVRITNIAGASVSLNDQTACNGSGYEDCTALPGGSCSLSAGTTYTATVKTGYTEMSCQIWIDFNNDGIFQPSESVGGIYTFGWGAGASPAILTIPASATPGTFRMRIVGDWSVAPGGVSYVASTSTVSIPPCPAADVNYGDARDYSVTILSPLSSAQLTVGSMQIYPNPATDELTIKITDPVILSGVEGSFSITNSIGQQMMQQSLTATQTKVDVSGLATGLYYITLSGDNGRKVQQFVKE